MTVLQRSRNTQYGEGLDIHVGAFFSHMRYVPEGASETPGRAPGSWPVSYAAGQRYRAQFNL